MSSRKGNTLGAIIQRDPQYVRPSFEPRPEPIGAIPAYQFTQLGVGCGVRSHNLDCLCDVHVSSETSVRSDLGLTFASIANNVHGTPTQANFYEWASTLLGCFETERCLVDRLGEQGVFARLPYQGQAVLGWFKLAPEVRDDLCWFAKNPGITFGMVAHLVPDDFTRTERAHVRKLFNKHKTDNNRKRKQ